LQLRGEAFNIFNHPNTFIAGPIDVATQGVTPGTSGCAASSPGNCPVVVAKKGGLGLNPSIDTRERRNMQLGVKITF
jgi:hypothetical protein